MKTSPLLTERAAHFTSGRASFPRKKSPYLRTLRKLPWPDQIALLFAAILGIAVGLALSPILLPLWILALIKKHRGPDKAPRPQKQPPEQSIDFRA